MELIRDIVIILCLLDMTIYLNKIWKEVRSIRESLESDNG